MTRTGSKLRSVYIMLAVAVCVGALACKPTLPPKAEVRVEAKHSFLDVTQDWRGVNDVEQDEEVFERFELLVSKISESSSNTVVAVTHAGFIKSVVSTLLSIPPTRMCILKIPNCSATVLDRSGGTWMLQQFSITGEIGGSSQ